MELKEIIQLSATHIEIYKTAKEWKWCIKSNKDKSLLFDGLDDTKGQAIQTSVYNAGRLEGKAEKIGQEEKEQFDEMGLAEVELTEQSSIYSLMVEEPILCAKAINERHMHGPVADLIEEMRMTYFEDAMDNYRDDIEAQCMDADNLEKEGYTYTKYLGYDISELLDAARAYQDGDDYGFQFYMERAGAAEGQILHKHKT